MPGAPLEFSSPRPNPARDFTHFALTLPERSDVLIEAYDLCGRKVRTLAKGSRAAGASQVAWDLADDRGQELSAGVYLVRARLLGQVLLRRVVVVR
jgi:flagellar hook assembly protein FlgD